MVRWQSASLLALAVVFLQHLAAAKATPTRDCSIAVIDLSHPSLALPACNLSQRVVSRHGVLHNREDSFGESHEFSQAAGPFYLEKAIRASKHFTTDFEAADLLFVYDYCYTTWHTSVAFGGTNEDGSKPAQMVQIAYESLALSDLYEKQNGRNFVFFAPHPLIGMSPMSNYFMSCHIFKTALHLVVESSQRYTCPSRKAWPHFAVVPYSSPAFTSDLDGDEPVQARDTLLFFLATCHATVNNTVNATVPYGLRLRRYIVDGVRASGAGDINVHCADERRLEHEALRAEMRRSLFCLLPPGETASSRRLTEIVLAGCIPVFVGPPWHAMPLAQALDYAAFALFMQCDRLSVLDEGAPPMTTPADMQKHFAPNVFDPAWWMPNADISVAVQTIEDVSAIPGLLRALPDTQVQRMQRALAAAQPMFRYRHTRAEAAAPAPPPNAADAIIDLMCQHAAAGQGSGGGHGCRAGRCPDLHRPRGTKQMTTDRH